MAAPSEILSILNQLTDNQWGVLLKQLTLYAEFKLDNIGFQPRSELDSLNGEDFAQEAIKRLIEGRRKWDPQKHPDLLIYLKLVVKSLISNHIKSSRSSPVRTKDLLESMATEEGGEDGTSFVDYSNQEEVIVSAERWSEIESAFGEDQDGFIFFTDWLDETSPREIAANYNVDVNTVNNKIRKGKRIITKLFAS
jgi:RNA polymerase sigma factor (sigma-70 family)